MTADPDVPSDLDIADSSSEDDTDEQLPESASAANPATTTGGN
jgi:hypothetical protein